MTSRDIATGILVGLLLSGCSQQAPNARAPRVQAAVSPAPRAAAAAEQGNESRRVAITDSFTLQVPANKLEEVHRRHVSECRRLGCLVLGTRLNRSPLGRVQAGLSLRISPAAFPELEAILTSAPAEVTWRTETAEDKTLPLLDIEKRLEAKTALRDRLTAMMRQPGQASISELAALEAQIAGVQSEIEAAIAERDYLRTITDTIRVDVDYVSTPDTVGGLDTSPIADALKNGFETVIRSTASLISFTLAVLPWVPLVAIAGWLLRRLIRPRRRAQP